MVEVTGWWSGFGGCVIWPLSVVLPEAWKFAVIDPLYKVKGDRTECSNYRGVRLAEIYRNSNRQSIKCLKV